MRPLPHKGRREENDLSHRAPSDDGETELARDEIDRGDRDQDHQDQERYPLPFQHADLLGELQIRVLEWQRVSFLVLMILVAVAAIDFISGKLRFAIIGRRAVA